MKEALLFLLAKVKSESHSPSEAAKADELIAGLDPKEDAEEDPELSDEQPGDEPELDLDEDDEQSISDLTVPA